MVRCVADLYDDAFFSATRNSTCARCVADLLGPALRNLGIKVSVLRAQDDTQSNGVFSTFLAETITRTGSVADLYAGFQYQAIKPRQP